jgi:hypothetical protein
MKITKQSHPELYNRLIQARIVSVKTAMRFAYERSRIIEHWKNYISTNSKEMERLRGEIDGISDVNISTKNKERKDALERQFLNLENESVQLNIKIERNTLILNEYKDKIIRYSTLGESTHNIQDIAQFDTSGLNPSAKMIGRVCLNSESLLSKSPFQTIIFDKIKLLGILMAVINLLVLMIVPSFLATISTPQLIIISTVAACFVLGLIIAGVGNGINRLETQRLSNLEKSDSHLYVTSEEPVVSAYELEQIFTTGESSPNKTNDRRLDLFGLYKESNSAMTEFYQGTENAAQL